MAHRNHETVCLFHISTDENNLWLRRTAASNPVHAVYTLIQFYHYGRYCACCRLKNDEQKLTENNWQINIQKSRSVDKRQWTAMSEFEFYNSKYVTGYLTHDYLAASNFNLIHCIVVTLAAFGVRPFVCLYFPSFF